MVLTIVQPFELQMSVFLSPMLKRTRVEIYRIDIDLTYRATGSIQNPYRYQNQVGSVADELTPCKTPTT